MQERVSLNYDMTSDVHEEIKSMKDTDREKDILKWLSAPDPSSNYASARQSRYATTGSWFLEGEDFARWKTDVNSLLWLHGKAGCGKTILSSTIIADRFDSCDGSDGSYLAYFFFDFNDYRKQQSSLMITSIIEQLYKQSHNIRVDLESLFSSHRDGQQAVDPAILLVILQAAVRNSTHTYIVLDALDECPHISDLLSFIDTIIGWGLPALHVLCTSRWLAKVEEGMQDITTAYCRVRLDNDAVDADISDYITYTVRNDSKLERWRGQIKVQEDIRVSLTRKANGM